MLCFYIKVIELQNQKLNLHVCVPEWLIGSLLANFAVFDKMSCNTPGVDSIRCII